MAASIEVTLAESEDRAQQQVPAGPIILGYD
jgi:hypothetical protein